MAARSDITCDAAAAAYLRHRSLRAAADELGCSYSTIRQRLLEDGVVLEEPGVWRVRRGQQTSSRLPPAAGVSGLHGSAALHEPNRSGSN